VNDKNKAEKKARKRQH